jgi:hypothetical protein
LRRLISSNDPKFCRAPVFFSSAEMHRAIFVLRENKSQNSANLLVFELVLQYKNRII